VRHSEAAVILETVQPFFNEKTSFRVKTTRGHNSVEIPLTAASLNGKVRIDPGSVPGEYVFLAIGISGEDF
jgi:hypothetical protein